MIWKHGDFVPSEGIVGFDTETEYVNFRDHPGWRHPRLAIAQFSQGDWKVIVKREDVCPFLHKLAAGNAILVAHHAPFDFWVVARLLEETMLYPSWWQMADTGRLICTLVLDQLVRLAEGAPAKWLGSEPLPSRSLKQCIKAYFDEEIAKDDEVRCGFGRLLEPDAAPLTHQETAYALDDAIWAERLYGVLERKARRLESKYHRKLFNKAFRAPFGLLSCIVQTKGAIALERLRVLGIGVDHNRLEQHSTDLIKAQGEAAQVLSELQCLEPILKVKNPPADARWVWTTTPTGRPVEKWIAGYKVNTRRLGERLTAAVRNQVSNFRPPQTPLGEVSLRREDWEPYARNSRLVRAYIQYRRSQKFISTFIEKYAKATRLHPRYRALVRSGRTSCYDPNLQQVPKRKGSLRNVFVPQSGYYLCEIDYKAIELSAVAQICLTRFGTSALAEALKSDPHRRIQEVMEERGHDIDRTTAKMANFGFAGGMGARTFCKHLKTLAGIEIDLEQARELRRGWLEAYPEFRRYLYDDLDTPGEGFEYFDPETGRVLEPDSWERRQIFCDLNHPANPALVEAVGAAEGGNWQEWEKLIGRTAVVPTGRIRHEVSYTIERNGPFQGLAADGAKLGLFSLVASGYRVVGFVHDSVLLEIPKVRYEMLEDNAVRLLLEAMKQVIPDVLVGVSVQGPLHYWGEKVEERDYWK